jgi:hypothetical protein
MNSNKRRFLIVSEKRCYVLDVLLCRHCRTTFFCYVVNTSGSDSGESGSILVLHLTDLSCACPDEHPFY